MFSKTPKMTSHIVSLFQAATIDVLTNNEIANVKKNKRCPGAGFSGFRRMFHEGDVERFDFQWGGRIYGVGDYNYQNMKKFDRPNLRIDGETIVEIDINASYLSILHGICGYPT